MSRRGRDGSARLVVRFLGGGGRVFFWSGLLARDECRTRRGIGQLSFNRFLEVICGYEGSDKRFLESRRI